MNCLILPYILFGDEEMLKLVGLNIIWCNYRPTEVININQKETFILNINNEAIAQAITV